MVILRPNKYNVLDKNLFDGWVCKHVQSELMMMSFLYERTSLRVNKKPALINARFDSFLKKGYLHFFLKTNVHTCLGTYMQCNYFFERIDKKEEKVLVKEMESCDYFAHYTMKSIS